MIAEIISWLGATSTVWEIPNWAILLFCSSIGREAVVKFTWNRDRHE
ncbi:hypothetical protein M0R72_12370 [Candidatus Pacearchaeota archaeon]|nr:hypothetical protein [Candidatus Pacearchaeota archaeon]